MQEIEKIRHEIDLIHAEMASLFRKRLELTEKIWQIKKEQSRPFFDAKRENEIIHRFDDQISRVEEKQALQNFFKSLLAENKKYLEGKLK
jgi:chorismate mutase